MNESEKIIEVAIPGVNIDGVFEYFVDNADVEKLLPGKSVVVSFFKKTYNAIILKIKDISDYDRAKLKKIISINDELPLLTPPLLKLAEWMAEYYVCSINRTLAFFIPSATAAKSKKIIRLICALEKYSEVINKLVKRNPHYKDLIEMLEAEKEIKYTTLQARLPEFSIDNLLNTLKKNSIIEIAQEFEEYKAVEESRIFISNDFNEQTNEYKLSAVQKKIIDIVKNNNGDYNSAQITAIAGCSSSPLKTLIKNEILEIRKIKKNYNLVDTYSEIEKNIVLTDEQTTALDLINNQLYKNEYFTFLLYGITGSGKTEIYMRAIQTAIDAGGECIMLVPEISLTPQTVARFKNRFGDKIAVLHSLLSQAERLEQWKKAQDGDTKIVVGARSAIFAPFKNLKLIIVDEEHENSYKQSESPAYNGRDAAIYRAFLESCPVILGSATPTLESYYNALSGKYKLIKLTKRADSSALIPTVEICDIKNELIKTDKFVFSYSLKEKIENALLNKQQCILFLNRRGFAPLVLCLSCGAAFKCPECNIPMTFHYEQRNLICHYCGYEILTEGKCPDCKSSALKFIGLGTEKIEIACKYIFADARIARIDADTVRKKNYLQQTLEKFKNRDIDILVGTQILAKGLDFPNVTVVGVILADITLNLPEFRAAERTFGLITQVSGRAGRSVLPGAVVVQTFSPDHYAIKFAAHQNYENFFNEEITYRKLHNYPPYTRLISIIFTGEREKEVKYYSSMLVLKLRENKIKNFILGPAPAAMPIIKKQYRYQVLLKGKNLNDAKKILRGYYNSIRAKNVKMFIDVDPQNMM